MASVSETHPTEADAKAPPSQPAADKVLPMARRAAEPSPTSDPPASAAQPEPAPRERNWLRPLLADIRAIGDATRGEALAGLSEEALGQLFETLTLMKTNLIEACHAPVDDRKISHG